ncbi:restriction endonuclease subunit S [Cerasibacillus terrae]|uniref:Restriction endonuclease subunit S n=1 Tax=Cerasibacillus terrae TaxID=2498845 RepID=A0A5C8NFI6_9BACI|nr:restriction endonuclease subunit S [Cerasibacillus terrae]TXL57569.1 restriction endonuclease subunit S [Cerasibacillus terrae]
MIEKKLVPKRRFEGFEDEWEQQQLKYIYNAIRNAFVGTATPYYVNSGHFYLQSNNVKDGKINRNTEVFINNDFYEKQKDKLLRTGDLVMVQSGHVGHTAVIPKELDKTAAHALIMFQGYKKEVSPYFLNYQFQTNKVKKRLNGITTGNTIEHILASDMEIFEVNTASIKEQQKIGEFFKRLDEMIELEQRKINKTKALKNAYLAEMFPAEGERVPKRRFEGFTDEWIPFKLKDLIVSEEKGNARADMLGHNSLYLDANFLNGGAPVYINSLTNVKEDDVLILWDGSHAGKVYHGFKGALGSTLKALKPLESGGFIYYFLYFNQKKIFEQYRTPNIPHVINTFTDEFMICKPSLEEQLKISGFFKKIDYIIETHKQKLEKLKAIKQAYLHEMFV